MSIITPITAEQPATQSNTTTTPSKKLETGSLTALVPYLVLSRATLGVQSTDDRYASISTLAADLLTGSGGTAGYANSPGVNQRGANYATVHTPADATTLAQYLALSPGGDGTFIFATADQLQLIAVALSAIDHEFDEDTTATAHTTSFNNRAALTFDSPNAEDWLVIASVAISATDDTVQSEWLVDLDSSDNELFGQETGNLDSESHVRTLARVYSLTAASHTFTVQSRDDTSAANSYASSRLMAIRLASFTDAHHAWTQTTTTSADVQTLTFTPPAEGDYLLIGSAVYTPQTAGDAGHVYLDVDGTTVPTGEADTWQGRTWGATDEAPMFTAAVVSLDATEHDITLKGLYSGSGTIGRRALVAIKLESVAVAPPTGNDRTALALLTQDAAVLTAAAVSNKPTYTATAALLQGAAHLFARESPVQVILPPMRTRAAPSRQRTRRIDG
ncbi:MAG: hypothetical protein AB7Q01_08665 [Gammaproteobacteria bacterium]